jgi:hypothetical protein
MLHGFGEAAVGFWCGAKTLHLPMNSGNANDAPLPVSHGHLAANDQLVGAVLFRSGFNGVDDGHAGSHDFLVAFDIHVRAAFGMEIVVGLADEFAFGGDPAVFATVPVPHDEAAFPVFHEKGHVRQQVKQLLEWLNGIELLEEILSELVAIHACKIHKIDSAIQAAAGESAQNRTIISLIHPGKNEIPK